MTDPDTDKKSTNGEENETEKSAIDDSVNVPLDDLDESKAQLIRSNGGAGDHAEVQIIDDTDKSSDQVSFNGLGKDEVMQYANDPFWVRLRWFLFILFWVGWFAMLVTAIVIIVVAPRCPPRPDLKWYQKDTVYQAYSKSFKDTDRDGYGDFEGLKKKLDYITDDMGANALYLNSIFKTDPDAAISNEDKDFAIVDHKDLDPKFRTTVAKLKSWIKDLRKTGQNVIVDLIPNLTGKKHEWFQKSRKSDKDFKDYYIWASSAANSSSDPPNDWKNMYGESAWSFDSERNQYYYHSRSKDLPDLNLNNEAVRKEILDIVKFWFGAGVGGFNIRDIEYLVEEEDTSKADSRNVNGTITFLKELRKVADDYSDKPGRERFLFGNVDAVNNDTMKYWENDGKVLHMIAPQFPFGSSCDASCLTNWIEVMPDSGNNWLALQLSNPDQGRFSSKATGSAAANFVNVAHAVQMLLPGTPFNYYGDEFGQKDGVDPKVNGRFNPINARTPMQWTDEKHVGFTEDDVTPWTAIGPNYKQNNLRISRSHYNDHSSFRLLKKLVDLRERESFQWGKTKACAPNKNLLLFTRKAERFPYFLTIINLSDNDGENPHLPSLKKCVESKEMGKVVFHSREDDGDKRDFSEAVKLEPGDIMVIEFAADD